MPGLAQSIDSQFNNATRASSLYSISGSNGSISANEFWSKHRDDVSYNQLLKFWNDLIPQARQELLRIDKQTLFEQARKNMYCSRCNGLLLEGFLQIVMYGKSLQQEGTIGLPPCNRLRPSYNQPDGDSGITAVAQDDVQDPSVHPWGGLTTTRDGMLTLLDCYLFSKSLKGLQKVFDSARARERERELLYPDACGGGGRGWISQGMVGYGRGHGTRETCALHTAKLSVDTLVDFWSALGDETRQSLLRMKEEDFMERLMHRFDHKRFCRDCRRNVIREFKELKELKRMRREPRCTSWFCVADTAFQYEVSHDTIQADWNQNFGDTGGKYHHFEWGVGTGEGKSDIKEFENVGKSGRVQVNGLNLGSLNACYITLRTFKMDGRRNEISVKAHALKGGQQCVHCRLVVGDGLVTITRGESIRRFFEHAEEAEEEEDEDSMDKDGNELDGECSRPQKHAKNPELAREFLLDAATVIFKEQVEKAFREGTARQNAHSIFVCLALKLLERRVHVACKEIITLEKQTKLLEEEEKEKRDEEERKERRRTKEREKKLRRKERLRGGKDKEDNDNGDIKSSSDSYHHPDLLNNEENSIIDEDPNVEIISNRDSVSDDNTSPSSRPLSPDLQEKHNNRLNVGHNNHNLLFDNNDNSRISRWKMKLRKDFTTVVEDSRPDRRRFAVVSESGDVVSKPPPELRVCNNGGDNFEFSSRGINKQQQQQQQRSSSSGRNNNVGGQVKFSEKFYCSNCSGSSRVMNDRYEYHSCSSCNHHHQQQNDYRTRVSRGEGMKCENKSLSGFSAVAEISKPYYRVSSNKYNNNNNQVEEYTTTARESCGGGGRPKSTATTTRDYSIHHHHHPKKVWEPMESQKKYYPRSNSASDLTFRLATANVESNNNNNNNLIIKASDDVAICSQQVVTTTEDDLQQQKQHKFDVVENNSLLKDSNSDNCSSCISEGDISNTSSSSSSSSLNSPNLESSLSSSTSDSEDASQHSEGKCHEQEVVVVAAAIMDNNLGTKSNNTTTNIISSSPGGGNSAAKTETVSPPMLVGDSQHQHQHQHQHHQHHQVLPLPMHHHHHNQTTATTVHHHHLPVFQAPPLTMGYYQSSPVSWSGIPPPHANGGGAAGFIPFPPHPNHYVFAASPYGYGGFNATTNSRCYTQQQQQQQYGCSSIQQQHHHHPVQVVPPQPVYHHHHHSIGGMIIPSSSKDQIKFSILPGADEMQQQQKSFSEGEGEGEGEGGNIKEEMTTTAAAAGNSEKTPGGGNSGGFSLFHFGGSAADNIVDDGAANHGAAASKEDHVKEYNLFAAASNGITFSFF